MTCRATTVMQAADFEEGEPLRALGRQVDPTAEVIKSLQRPVGPDVSVPVIRALVMGVLSLGMLPLWRWHHRLRDRIWNQQAQLRQVADWLWWKTGRIEAAELRRLAGGAEWRRGLGLASTLCLPVIFCYSAYFFSQVYPLSLQSLVAITYRFGVRHYLLFPDAPGATFFLIWMVGLCAGYLLHWLQLVCHVADLRRYTVELNRLLAAEGQPAMALPRLGPALRPLPVVGALVLVKLGALWGIPMMLAASASGVYAGRISRRFGQDLTRRIQAIAAGERIEALPRSCRRPRCGMILPAGAQFCPRCGLNVAGAVHRVA